MTTEIPVTEARGQFSQLLARAAHEPVYLTKHGRREAVVVSNDEYERLMEAAEDAEDLAASDLAIQELSTRHPAIPWETVKVDLGL